MDGSFLFDETREELAWFFRPSAPMYSRPNILRGTFWGELVRLELRLIWGLRNTMDRVGVGLMLRQFISNNPYRDVSLLTWCVAGFGLYEYSIEMVWILLPNLFVCALLRAVFQAPRPFEYDRQLRPYADRHIACYGFPSIESHMAVVVFGYLAHRLGTAGGKEVDLNLWHIGTGFAAGFVGLTRVYAGSRFSHQVALSWGLGTLSLWLYVSKLEKLVPDWGTGSMTYRQMRIALLAPWVLALLAYVALAIEDNSSNILRLPNSEFVRVMTHIMDVGAAASQREGVAADPSDRATSDHARSGEEDSDDGEDEDEALLGDPASGRGPSGRQRGGGGGGRASRSEQEQRGNITRLERRRRRLAARHDGFYFLQHSMRRKDMERQALKQEQSRDETLGDDTQILRGTLYD